MTRYIGTSLFSLALLIATAGFAQTTPTQESSQAVPLSLASDTVDVQHVIAAYHEAVLSHDGSRLARLFIPQGSLFLNVLSNETYIHAKAKTPDAVKIRIGSYTDFVKMVSTSKARLNPTHTHLQQNSNGTIASVYFDFVFLIDGKEQNRGSET